MPTEAIWLQVPPAPVLRSIRKPNSSVAVSVHWSATLLSDTADAVNPVGEAGSGTGVLVAVAVRVAVGVRVLVASGVGVAVTVAVGDGVAVGEGVAVVAGVGVPVAVGVSLVGEADPATVHVLPKFPTTLL